MLVRVYQSAETGRYFASKTMDGGMETVSKPEYAMQWKYGDRNRELNFNAFTRNHKEFIEEKRLLDRVIDVEIREE